MVRVNQPSVRYVYYTDPSIVGLSFGDNEYEGLDHSYKITKDGVDGEVVI